MRTLHSVEHAHVAEFCMLIAHTVHQRSARELTGRINIGVKVGVPSYRSEQASAIKRSGAVKAER